MPKIEQPSEEITKYVENEKEKNYPLCDKCQQPVSPNNNALLIEQLAKGSVTVNLFNSFFEEVNMTKGNNIQSFEVGRHLFPEKTCEGSPSRLQYIKGQPKDKRGYQYNLALEGKFRDAYAKVLDMVK